MARKDVSDIRIPQILEAAKKLFAEKGIDGASMADLSKEAELSKAAIYHYFKSKEELIECLINGVFSEDQPVLRGLVEAEGKAIERIQVYVDNLANCICDGREMFPIIMESFSRGHRTPSLFKCISNYFEGYADIFEKILEQGKVRGEFADGFDPKQAAMVIATQIEGSIVVSGITENGSITMLSENVRYLLDRL